MNNADISEYLRRPARSLEQYLDELYTEFATVTFGTERYRELLTRLDAIEDEIRAREGL